MKRRNPGKYSDSSEVTFDCQDHWGLMSFLFTGGLFIGGLGEILETITGGKIRKYYFPPPMAVIVTWEKQYPEMLPVSYT